MTNYLCKTCGVTFEASLEPPEHCPICEDERQCVPVTGQAWTTLDEIQASHRNGFTQLGPNLYSIKTEPKFAIGQQAHLIIRPEGNILWDCITLLDEATISKVKELGGIQTIAISHPHYYSSMKLWAETFEAKLYIHEADRKHVVCQSEWLEFWSGESLELAGATLINAAGHYDGGTVLHVPELADARGALLTGDIIQVASDPAWVSFMYSYPNMIPLSTRKIRHILKRVEPFLFEKIYGAFGGIVQQKARAAVWRSAERYIKAISD
ncbi:MAG: hypothetical protein KC422_09350 [Trueperaceae bacterium]|nr:hypothetical protein [Trueperaceae bacterium]